VTKRTDPNPEFDFFIPLANDLSLKDQRETMERPFFSLAKRKRVKPIEYTSPDGSVWVKVDAMPANGMATIWDADILIWAASVINRMRDQGVNDLPRKLTTSTYDLLRAIKRGIGGRDYAELETALRRLQTTSISTSIRQPKKRTSTSKGFNWLDAWEIDTDTDTGQPRKVTITLSDWVYEGIVGERALLTMHPDYFLLTGGLDRALYRIARKHVGLQRIKWLCRVETLREKTGSDSPSKEFNRMIRKAVAADGLPEYTMAQAQTRDGAAAILFQRRDQTEVEALEARHAEHKGQKDQAQRHAAERRRTAEVDTLVDQLARRSWYRELHTGRAPTRISEITHRARTTRGSVKPKCETDVRNRTALTFNLAAHGLARLDCG